MIGGAAEFSPTCGGTRRVLFFRIRLRAFDARTDRMRPRLITAQRRQVRGDLKHEVSQLARAGIGISARVDSLPGQLGVFEPGDTDVERPGFPGAPSGDLLDAVDPQGLARVDAEVLSARQRG